MTFNGFYVTLPCNASLDYFPQNTASNYKTKLAVPLNFKGKWEVGLSEISYLHSIPTIAEDCYLYLSHKSDPTLGYGRIPVGYYRNVDEIISLWKASKETMLKQLWHDKFIMQYNSSTRKVELYVPLDYQLTWVDDHLARIFGFKFYDILDNGWHKSRHEVDIHQGIHSLFVYTNLVTPNLVGDSVVPLLRTVPIEGEHGQLITKTYDRPHYVPVNGQSFEVIDINISDDHGNLIHFINGKVTIKLHFRPQRLPFM